MGLGSPSSCILSVGRLTRVRAFLSVWCVHLAWRSVRFGADAVTRSVVFWDWELGLGLGSGMVGFGFGRPAF
jgi:hypothetical protein